jgi:hypothetical protein
MERTPLTSGVSMKPVPKIGTENASQVEIEKNPRFHEEGACKELANVLPWSPPEHVRLHFFPTTTVRFDFKSLSSCVTPSSSRNATGFRPRAQRKEKQ